MEQRYIKSMIGLLAVNLVLFTAAFLIATDAHLSLLQSVAGALIFWGLAVTIDWLILQGSR